MVNKLVHQRIHPSIHLGDVEIFYCISEHFATDSAISKYATKQIVASIIGVSGKL